MLTACDNRWSTVQKRKTLNDDRWSVVELSDSKPRSSFYDPKRFIVSRAREEQFATRKISRKKFFEEIGNDGNGRAGTIVGLVVIHVDCQSDDWIPIPCIYDLVITLDYEILSSRTGTRSPFATTTPAVMG